MGDGKNKYLYTVICFILINIVVLASIMIYLNKKTVIQVDKYSSVPIEHKALNMHEWNRLRKFYLAIMNNTSVNGSNNVIKVPQITIEQSIEQTIEETSQVIHIKISSGLTGKIGQFSGLWKDLLNDLENTNNGVSQDWKYLKYYVGHNPTYHEQYPEDNFKTINGYGTVRYSQTENEYKDINYSKVVTNSNFGTACSICTTAQVMSTMTGRKVTPAEVAIAVNTYDIRHNTEPLWYYNVVSVPNLTKLFQETGFNVEYCQGSLIDNKENVDKTLDNNGMIIIVIKGGTIPWGLAGENHYIAIRNRVGDKYYAVDCGNRSVLRYIGYDLIRFKDAGQGYILVKEPPKNLGEPPEPIELPDMIPVIQTTVIQTVDEYVSQGSLAIETEKIDQTLSGESIQIIP